MDAMQVAMDAKRAAEAASSDLKSHEAVCAERYKSISQAQTEIKSAQKEATAFHLQTTEKIYIAIHEVGKSVADLRIATSNASGKASGADTLFRYLCLFIATLIAVWGFLK